MGQEGGEALKDVQACLSALSSCPSGWVCVSAVSSCSPSLVRSLLDDALLDGRTPAICAKPCHAMPSRFIIKLYSMD